jgi:hypothetical protein
MCRDANHIDSGIVGMFKEHGSSTNKIFNYLLHGSYPKLQVFSMQWKHDIFAAKEPI